jgi:hypothetical protein
MGILYMLYQNYFLQSVFRAVGASETAAFALCSTFTKARCGGETGSFVCPLAVCGSAFVGSLG